MARGLRQLASASRHLFRIVGSPAAQAWTAPRALAPGAGAVTKVVAPSTIGALRTFASSIIYPDPEVFIGKPAPDFSGPGIYGQI